MTPNTILRTYELVEVIKQIPIGDSIEFCTTDDNVAVRVSRDKEADGVNYNVWIHQLYKKAVCKFNRGNVDQVMEILVSFIGLRDVEAKKDEVEE